jgi:putative ABC transport system substrate-binding protein
MIARRKLVFALGASALIKPFGALAQRRDKVWRIGFFYVGSRQSAVDTGRYGAFLEAMRDLGYVQGKDFVLEERFAPDGAYERLPALAAELVGAKVDVIVAAGGPSSQALKQVTTSVPVVVTVTADPVREGLAATLARPGGNFTGLSAFLDDVFPKHVELLKIAVPGLSRLAALVKPGNQGHPHWIKGIEAVARRNTVQVLPVEVGAVTDLEPAFATIAQRRAQALIILGDSFFVQHFRRIAELSIKHRLASTYSGQEYPDSGGFMSYGPNFADNYRRAASFVDKILKGAKPAELPFEQPTRFYLILNRKTAKAMGLAVPEELLLRADRVIE